MAPEIITEKTVQFRGVWCAGNHISERMIRTIFAEVPDKPFRLCRFQITSFGISLELPPTVDGKKERRLSLIDFQNIQDMLCSPQNKACFVIIYLDAKRTLNALACSSNNHEDVMSIYKTYLSEKLRRQPHAGNANWTLRQRVSVTGDLPHADQTNGAVIQPGYGFSYRSYSNSEVGDVANVFLEDDVFQDRRDEVFREPVDRNKDGVPEAYHAAVQTHHIDGDTTSLASETSFQTLRDDIQSMSEDVKVMKVMQETSTGISAEEYHRRAHHGAHEYYRRSISVQTDKLSQRNRYAKNPMSPSVSSSYKDKMAVHRKRSSGSGSAVMAADGHVISIGPLTNGGKPHGTTGVKSHDQGRPLIRSMSTGRTTVNKPIEQVYRPRAGSQIKRIIITQIKP